MCRARSTVIASIEGKKDSKVKISPYSLKKTNNLPKSGTFKKHSENYYSLS